MGSPSIYTEDEQAILDKVKDVRIRVIDTMIKDGIPERPGTIRVLNEVLASTDKMIADTASIRIKKQDSDNNGANVALAVELLKQARANKQTYTVPGVVPSIPNELTKIDAVAGETDINPEPLDPKDFVAPKFNPKEIKE